MGLFKRKKKKEVLNRDFNARVLEEHIVPTIIYSRNDAVGFSVKERGSIFGNLKRGKPYKL